MKIAIVSPGPVPCIGYGGTERQAEWLARALARKGHQVTVLAPHTSPISGLRMLTYKDQADLHAGIPGDVDIVHFHGRWPMERGQIAKPFVNTAHNLLPDLDISRADWCFVSAFHARWQSSTVYVNNGFPVDEYPLVLEKSKRLLFLAGIARPGKDLTRAVRLARKFDFELDIAGGHRWELLTRSKIRAEGTFFLSLPSRFRFHGIVDGPRKMALLGKARAFINPIRVEEPFGMAPVEAMLTGTPVLATPLAAMPDMVTEETGFLFENDEQFEQGLATIDRLDPRAIRHFAAEHYSIDRTADGYLAIYEAIHDGGRVEDAICRPHQS